MWEKRLSPRHRHPRAHVRVLFRFHATLVQRFTNAGSGLSSRAYARGSLAGLEALHSSVCIFIVATASLRDSLTQ